jgi:hypothetical protein
MDSSHFTVGTSRDLAPFHSYKDSNEQDLYLLLLKRCYIRGGSKRPGPAKCKDYENEDEDEQDDLSFDDSIFSRPSSRKKGRITTNRNHTLLTEDDDYDTVGSNTSYPFPPPFPNVSSNTGFVAGAEPIVFQPTIVSALQAKESRASATDLNASKTTSKSKTISGSSSSISSKSASSTNKVSDPKQDQRDKDAARKRELRAAKKLDNPFGHQAALDADSQRKRNLRENHQSTSTKDSARKVARVESSPPPLPIVSSTIGSIAVDTISKQLTVLDALLKTPKSKRGSSSSSSSSSISSISSNNSNNIKSASSTNKVSDPKQDQRDKYAARKRELRAARKLDNPVGHQAALDADSQRKRNLRENQSTSAKASTQSADTSARKGARIDLSQDDVQLRQQADTAARSGARSVLSPTSSARSQQADTSARAAHRRNYDAMGPEARETRLEQGHAYRNSAVGAATRAAYNAVRRANYVASPSHASMTGTWDYLNKCR